MLDTASAGQKRESGLDDALEALTQYLNGCLQTDIYNYHKKFFSF